MCPAALYEEPSHVREGVTSQGFVICGPVRGPSDLGPDTWRKTIYVHEGGRWALSEHQLQGKTGMAGRNTLGVSPMMHTWYISGTV